MNLVVVQVVEDNADIAQMLSVLLQLNTENVTVRTITNDFGRALNVEEWDGVDVAVVDLMLPKVDGRTILAFLRDNLPDIRRVVYSGVAELQVRDDLAHAWVSKGADYRTILTALGLT